MTHNPPAATRRRAWACNLTALVIFVIVGGLFWMAIDRDPPFIRTYGEVIPENPRPGQWVAVKWHVKGSRWCPGTLQRQIIDSHDVVWTLDKEPIAFGTRIPVSPDFVRRFQIPPVAWPGRAVYRVTTAYQCNPLHRWWPVVTTGPDVVFEIAPP